MRNAVCSATSFEQRVSEWDVANVTGATSLERKLKKLCEVSSFFDGDYRALERIERRQLFGWDRRVYFLLFLVQNGHFYTVYTINCDNRNHFRCDILFNVEDINRIIFKFL